MERTLRDRARSEGGFTLIELLVVMIIIAILMAVAVPTFLSQKNGAQKTKAIANIKQIVTAVESCSQNNTNASYAGCATNAAVQDFEPSLKNLQWGSAVDTYNVTSAAGATPQGYQVSTSIKDGDKTIWFVEWHGENALTAKICGEGAAAPAYSSTVAPTSSGVATSRTCPASGANAGKWG